MIASTIDSTARYRRRRFANALGLGLSAFAMLVGLFALGWILWTLVSEGFAALDWAFFTRSTPAPGTPGGGMANAIVGSLLMVGVATVVSTPIGILAGIYLAEVGAEARFPPVTPL